MKPLVWVAVNFIGFVILVFMYYTTDKTKGKRTFGQRLFGYLQITIMLYLVFDTGMYLADGTSFKTGKILNYVFTSLYYLIVPVTGLLYLIYCDYRIYNDEKGLKKRLRYYSIPAVISAIAVFLSLLYKTIFYIDENNIYHRGAFFWFLVVITFGYVFASYPLLAIKTKNKPALTPKGLDLYYYLFQIPPSVLAILQLMHYGPLLLGMGFVISTFFIFTNSQACGKEYSLSVRFRNITITQFAIISFIMTAGMFWSLSEITNKISEDYAVHRAVNNSIVLSTYLNKEIGIIKTAAHSKAVTEWFLDEDNPEKKQAAFEELTSILSALYNNNLYIVVSKSGNEYTIERGSFLDDFQPHAVISGENPDDKWFFDLMPSFQEYRLIIDIDKELQRKRVWLNYKVTKNNDVTGAISTGMDFSRVAEKAFSRYENTKTRALIIDEEGIICMDSALLGKDDFLLYGVTKKIDEEFSDTEFLNMVYSHLGGISGYFQELAVEAISTELKTGRYKYATITPIGTTSWSVVTLFDSSSLYSPAKLFPLFVIITVLFLLFAFSSNTIIRRLIFKPLKKLVDSMLSMRESDYQKIYGLERKDEIGILSNTIQDLFIMGHYDGLTGIYNRRYMETTLLQVMTTLSRTESILSFMMIDVDFFKKFNDTYGHNKGDECLKAIAEALSAVIYRKGDFVARYGGEEFAVVLPGTDEAGALIIAEKMLQAIRDLNIPHEKNKSGIVTISIGIVTGKFSHTQSRDDYLKKADEALYMSKHNGRDRCTFLPFTEEYKDTDPEQTT